ncbi:MAG: excisionase family DNA-binding protein, partial [Chloroflexi bacterium]|nr:excisionase family DNA-binding protein [Chloroflexota bacterium]
MKSETTIERLAYRPDEAARALGCSRDTIFRLLASGRLRSYRVGAARFISAEVLRAFIAA